MYHDWDLFGGPGDKTPNTGGPGLIPGQGTKIPHTTTKPMHGSKDPAQPK